MTENSPVWSVEVELSLTASGFAMNNHVYYAEGSVTIKSRKDGVTVAVVPVKSKGFHRTREQAALNALREAGAEAATVVSDRIRSGKVSP